MKKSLPCLSALAAVIVASAAAAQQPAALPPGEGRVGSVNAVGASEATYNSSQVPVNPTASSQADQPPSGNQLVMQAASQLERHASASARLCYAAAIEGKQLQGAGNYWQQGSGDDLKVRLELRFEGKDAQLLQVCNSRFMWLDRKLPTGRAVTRVDLKQLRADPTIAASNLSDIKTGEASWSPVQSELTPYMGGVPTLLGALNDSFNFLPPQSSSLELTSIPGTEAIPMPVYAVVGHWKPEKIAALLAKTPANGADSTQSPATRKHAKGVPARLPEEVLLLVRKGDLFPCHIEYRRLETPEITTGDGPAIPYQLSVHPMVVLEFTDVIFDAPIAASLFDYAPGNVDFTDQTAAILQRLRDAHQAQIATRPAAPAPAGAR